MTSTPHPPGTRTVRWGGVVLLLSAVQFLGAEAVTAAGWSTPPYSYARNFISDLGVTSCGGVFAGNVICSPRHVLMNTGFVLHGLLFAVAGVLLAPLLATRGRRRACRVLSVGHGIGFVLAAIVHGSPEAAADGTFLWHGVGALLIVFGGNLAAIVVGVDLLRTPSPDGRSSAGRRQLGIAVAALGVLGPVALILLLSQALPIGAGITERLAIYPIMLTELLLGIALLRSGRAGSGGTPTGTAPARRAST